MTALLLTPLLLLGDAIFVGPVMRPIVGAGGPSYFGGLVTTNGLTAYWRMDEFSDGSGAVSRADSWGSETLTDNNTCPSVTGQVTNAVDMTTANTEYLSHADDAPLSLGTGTSFSITGWARFKDLGATRPVIAKATATGAATEYAVFKDASDRLIFRVGDGSVSATVTNTLTSATNVWYFFGARCDLTADRLDLYVQNASGASSNAFSAYTGDTQDTSSAMEVGRLPYSTSNRQTGAIDELALWKGRVLTTNECGILATPTQL